MIIKTITQDNKKILFKEFKEETTLLAIEHNNQFKSTINMPKIADISKGKELTKDDVSKLGHTHNNFSSLQIINTDLRLDMDFLFQKPCYVEDISLIKNILKFASNKNKGCIVFDNNNQLQNYLKKSSIDCKIYNKANLKIKYSDLNEKILLDTLNLSNKEQSIIASFMQYKQQNKDNVSTGLDILTGENWLYDLFLVEPLTISQQFKVPEYSVKLLKTTLLQLNANGMMSEEFSNINEIIKSAQSDSIIIIDVPDCDKKFVKSILSQNSKGKPLTIIDHTYHRFDNLNYILYNCHLFAGTTRDFNSFILNKKSFYLQEELIDMTYFSEEIKFLDFEYLLIKDDCFPTVITNETYIENTVAKKTTISNQTVGADFF